MVGSRIIRQAIDFKTVGLIVLTSLTSDISMAIQIFGRGVRKDSHADLPPALRNVDIIILVSVASDWDGAAVTVKSPELWRWAEKMREYQVIQRVRRALHASAVDGFANVPRMRHSGTLASTNGENGNASLETLSYEPQSKLDDTATINGVPIVKKSTFYAYGHAEREVANIVSAIWVLFGVRPVWTYEDLCAALRSGAVETENDPKLYESGAVARALERMMRTRRGNNVTAINGGVVINTIIRAEQYYIATAADAGGNIELPDYEFYIRAPGNNSVVATVVLADYLRGAHSEKKFTVRWPEYVNRYLHPPAVAPIDHALVDETDDFHQMLLRRLVEAPGQLGVTPSELAAIIASYRRFKVLLYADHLPAAARVYLAVKPLATGAPIGYLTQNSAQVYVTANAVAKWVAVPLAALNYTPRLRENNIIVGFLSTSSVGDRLKIRLPLAQIKARTTTTRENDERTVPRGAVCETRPHAEQQLVLKKLRQAAARLGIKRPESAPDACDEIKSLILGLESAARLQPQGMETGLRWLYIFHDSAPTPTSKGTKTTE
jgi:hypothetical protein